MQVYAQPAGALTPVDAAFDDGVTLRGFVAAPDTLAPGGLLTVHLDWASTPGTGTANTAGAVRSARSLSSSSTPAASSSPKMTGRSC